MKRVVALILCAVMILALSVSAFADGPTPRNIAFACDVDAAFLRRGPGESYQIIGQFSSDEVFWAGNDYEGSWHYGYPDTNTNICREFGSVYGWANLDNFRIASMSDL